MDTFQLRLCFLDVLRNLDTTRISQYGDPLMQGIARHAARRQFMPTQERGREQLPTAEQTKVRELFWSFIIQGVIFPGVKS